MEHFKQRRLVLAIFASLLAVVLIILFARLDSANAEGAANEPCVPKDAWIEVVVVTPAVPGTPGTPAVPPVTAEVTQHYSWTGGKRDTDNPPTVVPPHEDWQANTTQEPHDNGQGNPATWVNDSLHYTANSKGHASWFYFERKTVEVTPGIPAVPGTPEIPAVTKEVFHEAVVCVTETPTVPTVTVTPDVVEPTVVVPPVETVPPVITPEETETPTPEEDETTKTVRCVGNALVTVVNGPDGKSTSTVNGHPRCEVDTTTTTPGQPTEVVEEEGL